MQKVLTILERNVQWFALGLGAVFVLWMAYAYLLSPPTIQIDPRGAALTPGEVDEYIRAKTAKDLRDKIDDPTQIPWPVKDPREELAAVFELRPALGQIQVVTPGTTPTTPPSSGPQPELVALVAAVQTERRVGRSLVALAEKPADKPAGEAKPPRRPPVAPAGGGAAGAPADNRETRDVDWVSLLFRVNMEKMTQQFEAARIPPEVFKTRFLRTTLVRQEMQQNGQWGPETVVNPLPGVDLSPLPAENANKVDQYNYLTFAQQNLPAILQPAFLDVVPGSGTQWIWPGSPEPAQQNPVRPVAAPPLPRPAALPMPGAPLPMPGGPRAAARPPGGGGLLPMPGAQPDAPPFLPPPAGMAPGAGMPMMPPMPMPGGGVGMPANQMLPGGNTQDGMFNPAEVGDFDILAHDIDVRPGRTYRYKLRYTVLNPVWNGIANVPNVPPAVAGKFALTSPDSPWTEPILIPERVQFWLAGADVRKSSASFDVFAWDGAKGGWGLSRVTVSPGDAIGKSSWTVVDVRGTVQRPIVLVADQNGQTARRDPRVDPNDPDYLKMKDQTAGTAMAPP